MEAIKLTNKQQKILDTVGEMVSENKENPTAYGVCKHLQSFGLKESVKGVTQVLESLEKKELITRDDKRRIYVVENDNYANQENMFALPFYGLASCGEALAHAEDNIDGYVQISKSLFRDVDPIALFAIKALGDSMDRDNIADGDYVVFEKYEQGTDCEGKIVVAVINGMATIKRYKNLGGGAIGLFPHSTNTAHQPIYIHEDDTIIVAGVFKRVLPVSYMKS